MHSPSFVITDNGDGSKSTYRVMWCIVQSRRPSGTPHWLELITLTPQELAEQLLKVGTPGTVIDLIPILVPEEEVQEL